MTLPHLLALLLTLAAYLWLGLTLRRFHKRDEGRRLLRVARNSVSRGERAKVVSIERARGLSGRRIA